MSGRASLATAIAIGIALCCPPAARAGEKVGDIEVTVQPLPSKDTVTGTSYGVYHGYVELRVQLKNPSASDRMVHLSYPPWTHERVVRDGVVVTRQVPVAAGQVAVVSLFKPSGGSVLDMLEVEVDGVRDPGMIPLADLSDYRFDEVYPPSLLLSRSVPQEFHDRVHGVAPAGKGISGMVAKSLGSGVRSLPVPRRGMPFPSPSSSSPSTAPFALLRSELPMSQWSTNWLGYSCYDAIVVTAKDAEEMPPPVQLAVRRYLECGGTLLVHGREVPAAFSQGGDSDGNGGYFVGLGHVLASAGRNETDWNATHRKLTRTPLYAYHPVNKPTFSLDEFLVAETTVPVRGLFVLVLLFAVGIGPANLWLLSRYKRRIWLWWNVPAISLLTCLVVFAYSLVSEGITGRGKTASMTLLDERFHRATTIGYISYYCPLTPSTGPRFGVDTDVTLLENNLDPYRRFRPRGAYGSLRVVDWSADQHLASGWVNARVPAYFQLRKNEDRRERLAVEKQKDGSLRIVNALGADIRRLYWADAAGRIFEGREIPAGAERTLTPAPKGTLTPASKGSPAPGGGLPLLRLTCHGELLGGFRRWTLGDPAAVLSPGCYLAYLDKSPFVESPLAGVEPEHTVAIVYGISKGHDDGR